MKHIVVMPQGLSRSKICEGLAIHRAVVSGECDRCAYLPDCSSDNSFKMPADAYCMKEKARLFLAGDRVVGVDLGAEQG